MGQVTLFNMSQKVFEDLLNNIDSFEADYNVKFEGNGKLIADITSITMHMVDEKGCSPEWGGYFAIDSETRVIIGTCAFKGAPDAEGQVEVACFTFPKYEGKGFGTAMINELIEIAKHESLVKLIFANSLPQKNASTKILEKCGFTCKGEVHDPEDGLVWRWEYLTN